MNLDAAYNLSYLYFNSYSQILILVGESVKIFKFYINENKL
jgi:hypothetical protein